MTATASHSLCPSAQLNPHSFHNTCIVDQQSANRVTCQPLTHYTSCINLHKKASVLGWTLRLQAMRPGSLSSVTTTMMASYQVECAQLRPRDKTTERLHRNKQRTNCPICRLDLLKKTLPRHMRSRHLGAPTQLRCLLCDETFSRPDTLERHEREQHGGERNMVDCDICGERVCSRALNEHKKSQKCKNARLSALQSKSEHNDLGFHVLRVVPSGLDSLSDPLVVAAWLHRYTLLARWTAESKSASADVGRLRQHDDTLVLPSDILPELWRLRQIALTQTRAAVKRIAHSSSRMACSRSLVDDSVIQISLLNAADTFIFGDSSVERQYHIHGLSHMLNGSPPTLDLISKLARVLSHAWSTEIRPPFASSAEESAGFEISLKESASETDDTFPDRSGPRSAPSDLLRHRVDRSKSFWNNFIPGVWGVWKSAKPLTTAILTTAMLTTATVITLGTTNGAGTSGTSNVVGVAGPKSVPELPHVVTWPDSSWKEGVDFIRDYVEYQVVCG